MIFVKDIDIEIVKDIEIGLLKDYELKLHVDELVNLLHSQYFEYHLACARKWTRS